jgi:expansin (peptidoglycan-binding protein)
MRSCLVLPAVLPALLLSCSTEDGAAGAASPGAEYGAGSSAGGDSGTSPPTTSTEMREGVATFYDADGSGNCSFDASPSDLRVAALAFPDYAASATCGACLKVTGPKGAITVRVVDSCPPCDAGHVDLSKEAFVKIADEVQGRVPITFQTVACDVVGPITYRFKEGSSRWWTAIQVRNHRVPVTKLEYQKGGAWVAMRRTDYNYFLEDKGVGDVPAGGLRVRVSGADGTSREDTLPAIAPGAAVQGGGAL